MLFENYTKVIYRLCLLSIYEICISFHIGVVSLVGICGYGAYGFRNKKISTPMYLIHLRVAAQGTAIGCLMIGMVTKMVQKYVLKENDKD